MNYYIIPKNNFNIRFKLNYVNEEIEQYISHSLIYYLNKIHNQLLVIKNDINNKNTIEYIYKIINPLEYINTNVPSSNISVSKVKPESNIFFELLEIFQICNVKEYFLDSAVNIAHLTHNFQSTNYLLNMQREYHDQLDYTINQEFDYQQIHSMFINNQIDKKLDLIIIEFKEEIYSDVEKYIKNMILVLHLIIKQQSNLGMCILKIDNIFYKPIIDILFIFSGLYDKIYLIKPNISNITNSYKYIICKTFNSDIVTKLSLLNQIEQALYNININNKQYVSSLIENQIPCYFLNKLEEINSVLGQQQLEAYDQIINIYNMNIYNNKTYDEKIENLKRGHIQKCIQWCEKHEIPYNKFIDKTNIFLNTKQKDEYIKFNDNIEECIEECIGECMEECIEEYVEDNILEQDKLNF